MADEDRDEDDEQARLKKVRGATDEAQADARESSSTPLPQANEAADVKEVTQGVKEVELEEKPQALPESVPLPEEQAGELDADASSTASTPPPVGEPSEAPDAAIAADTAPEPASGDAVSDLAEADIKDTQLSTDTPDVVAADSDAAPVPIARPIKKLRAKSKTTTAPAAPAEG
jgi:hypothetical protein